MRILVTGATGFIGGHLTRHLLARGYNVRALVRRESPSLIDLGAALAYGDLTDAEAMRAAVENVEAVFHLAAMRDKWHTPESVYQRVNVEGTQHLLKAADDAGVRRFVYCSSVGVARYPGNLEADETLPFSEPTSQVLYHHTKAEAERMALDAQAIVVRPVITYGPGDERGFVTRLIALLRRGQRFWIGDGRNHVDLVYVDDLVDGMRHALEHGRAGRRYILSGTAPIRVQLLVDKICNLAGKSPPRIHIPTPCARLVGWGMETLYRTGERMGLELDGQAPFITRDKIATLTVDRGFSHARAKRELGYEPRIGYDEGLRRTLDWLREADQIRSLGPVSHPCPN